MPFLASTKNLVLKALKSFFKGNKPEVDPDLWQATYDTLAHAIQEGTTAIEYNKPNFKLTRQLRESAALFSAQKSWAQAKELAAIAEGKDGKTPTWKEFQEAAKPIVGDYNQRWLKTEFNTALRAARQASLWKEYEAQAHLYPNLRYMPSRAATPREEHKPWYGVVRPIGDDFWVNHMPPSAWNCLCGVEQTDDDATPIPANGPKAAKGLDKNAGLTGDLISNTNPFGEQVEKAGKTKVVSDQAKALKKKRDYALIAKEGEYKVELRKAQEIAPQFPKMDVEELATIRMYTGTAYEKINMFKRGDLKKTPVLSALADVLQSALEKLGVYKKPTHRGTSLDQKFIDQYSEALRLGQPVTHKFFTSSAKDGNLAFRGNVKYVIDGKTGRDIEAISRHGAGEQEVLFMADTKFEVLSVTPGSPQTVIVLKEI